MTKIGRILITIALFIFAAPIVLAAQSIVRPTFPTCKTPQGELIVSYSEGVHGIPGDFSTHTGSDKVYYLSDNTLSQCFCAIDGKGTQTNWWKASSLSFEEIETLKKEGWIYVPNGAVWGLLEDPYLTKNTSYDCSTKKDDGVVHDADDDDNDNDESETIGEVLGMSTERIGGIGGSVLGLAATGNTSHIAIAILLGAVFISATLIRFKNEK